MGRVYLDVSCKAGNKDPVNVEFCLRGGESCQISHPLGLR